MLFFTNYFCLVTIFSITVRTTNIKLELIPQCIPHIGRMTLGMRMNHEENSITLERRLGTGHQFREILKLYWNATDIAVYRMNEG
jgi:hypothetical protein